MKQQPARRRGDENAPSPINDHIDWTAADEQAADAAMAHLNAQWDMQATHGTDVDAQMAQEVDALDEDDDSPDEGQE